MCHFLVIITANRHFAFAFFFLNVFIFYFGVVPFEEEEKKASSEMMFHVLLHQQLQPVSGSPQSFTDVVPQLFLFLFLTALVCT